ncbi:hypothetical protein T637_09675 [Enterobacter hormaechei subsp. hoffmannii]|uniref:hypothetical protein n=1 Tax=Enterobacter hormaechei TaxID=158836 RepID=UPI0006274E20|nr:hypothetical protein [Enterobacter hormaechei]KKJ32115.1 hypothetical protein T637_09675 [Enterobacter hormaechei subsp. hoffmannii]
MSKENHGGPAFPHIRKPVAPGVEEVITNGGMSLRDYFAAMAMQGKLSNPEWMASDARTATEAYEMADAMLRAREAS